MTRNEFETLTGVKVTPEEFWTINDFYNTTECSKEGFCNYWKLMNPARCQAAAVESKGAALLMEAKEFAYDLMGAGYTTAQIWEAAENPLSWKQICKYNEYAQRYGFMTSEMLEEAHNGKLRLVDMLYELLHFTADNR